MRYFRSQMDLREFISAGNFILVFIRDQDG